MSPRMAELVQIAGAVGSAWIDRGGARVQVRNAEWGQSDMASVMAAGSLACASGLYTLAVTRQASEFGTPRRAFPTSLCACVRPVDAIRGVHYHSRFCTVLIATCGSRLPAGSIVL